MTLKEKIYEIIKDLKQQKLYLADKEVFEGGMTSKEQGRYEALQLSIGLLEIALREAEREEK